MPLSGHCSPEVDIPRHQFAPAKQARAIFQPRNRMFSQATLRVSSSNWTISSEAQSICEEAKKAPLQKRGQKVWGRVLRSRLAPVLRSDMSTFGPDACISQVRWKEKPYCELDDDLVRHCSSISEHNGRNPTIDLLDEI